MSCSSRRSSSPLGQATLPTGWEVVEIDVPDGYTTMLPVPTLVIRTDNQDSYQGPVSGL